MPPSARVTYGVAWLNNSTNRLTFLDQFARVMYGGVKLASPLRVFAISSAIRAIRAPAGIHGPVAVASSCSMRNGITA